MKVLVVLCLVVAAVMAQPSPAAKPTHELKLTEMTRDHLKSLMENSTRVAALTDCFIDISTCNSLEAKNLHEQLAALGVGGSCLSCTPEEQAYVSALLKAFAAALRTHYAEQFKKASEASAVLQKLLTPSKATHELLLTEYTPTHLADLMANQTRVAAVTACFSDPSSCQSLEATNLLGQLKALSETGGVCTTCTPQERLHVQNMLAEFVKAYEKNYPEQYKSILPVLGSLLKKPGLQAA